MNKGPNASIPSYNSLPIKRLVPTTLAVATLAISGCATQSSQEAPAPALDQEDITLTAAKLPQGECSLHFVEPNSKLKEQKSSKLQKDLGLLSMLKSKDEKAKFSDIATASGIIYDSYKDPIYAQAITKANQQVRRGKKVSVQQLKTLKTDKLRYCEDKNHVSKKDARNQYHRMTSIGQYTLRGLASKYAKQGSSLAERTLDRASESFDALKNSLDQATK